MNDVELFVLHNALDIARQNALATLAAVDEVLDGGLNVDEADICATLATISDNCSETQIALDGLYRIRQDDWTPTFENNRDGWDLDTFLSELSPDKREYYDAVIPEAKSKLSAKFSVDEEDVIVLPTTHRFEDETWDLDALMVTVKPSGYVTLDSGNLENSWDEIENDANDKYLIELNGEIIDVREHAKPERMALLAHTADTPDTAFWVNSDMERWTITGPNVPAKYVFAPTMVLAYKTPVERTFVNQEFSETMLALPSMQAFIGALNARE